MTRDVLKDEIITTSEITRTFAKYFKDADSLINKFEFGCLYHDDYRCGKIVQRPDFNIHGSGFLDNETDMYQYALNSTILWETHCKCGEKGIVGFILNYHTKDWIEIKEKLQQETLSEKNMKEKLDLDGTSDISFIHYIPYRKKGQIIPTIGSPFPYVNEKHDLYGYLE